MPPDIPELSPPGSAPGSDTSPGKRSLRLVWIMLALVLGVALFVVLVLPSAMRSDDPSQRHQPLPRAPAQPVPSEDSGSVARNDAEAALRDYLKLRAQPLLSNAERWSGADWENAAKLADSADAMMGRRQYDDARALYEQASAMLDEVLARRDERFEQLLGDGFEALNADDSETALNLFELALLMEPGHEQALSGQARARVREDLLHHIQEAEIALSEGRLDAAREAYSAALELDPDYQQAEVALQALEERLREMRFEQALGRALNELEDGRLAQASRSLQEAASIHPQAEPVRDLQQRLEQAQQAAALAELRRAATRAVDAEDWLQARKLYRKAMVIDAATAFARNGLPLAEQRIELHRQLDHYLDEPDRLYSPEPLENAGKLIASLGEIPAREPALASKVEKLDALVAAARTPVEVLLESDNNTEVSIYHVGQFGRFTEKRLQLRPGRYTVTGSRSGYRDVRKVLTLEPGSDRVLLLIRCEEPV